jgi:hypothetical protein
MREELHFTGSIMTSQPEPYPRSRKRGKIPDFFNHKPEKKPANGRDVFTGAGNSFPITGVHHPVIPAPAKRYASSGTEISNLAPAPSVPVSLIVIPVIPRISRARNNPRPVFFP